MRSWLGNPDTWFYISPLVRQLIVRLFDSKNHMLNFIELQDLVFPKLCYKNTRNNMLENFPQQNIYLLI